MRDPGRPVRAEFSRALVFDLRCSCTQLTVIDLSMSESGDLLTRTDPGRRCVLLRASAPAFYSVDMEVTVVELAMSGLGGPPFPDSSGCRSLLWRPPPRLFTGVMLKGVLP